MRTTTRTKKKPRLSPREQEIMEIIFRRGSATVAEVIDDMAEPPSYSAVRGTISVLENKGHLSHKTEGTRYVYQPTVDLARARRSALEHLMSTFFEGSAAAVVSALLEERGESLSEEELDRLSKLVAQAREEGR